MVGLAVLVAPPVAAHTVRVNHHSGPVEAKYSGDLVVTYKQIGTVAPGGVASTLRCSWIARIAVERTATTASGNMISRSFVSDKVAEGSRHGWCDSSRAAITDEAARHEARIDHHLKIAARQDESFLRTQLNGLEGSASSG